VGHTIHVSITMDCKRSLELAHLDRARQYFSHPRFHVSAPATIPPSPQTKYVRQALIWSARGLQRLGGMVRESGENVGRERKMSTLTPCLRC